LSIFVIYGLEQYTIDKELTKIINKDLESDTIDFSVNIYDCDETAVQIAIEDAEMLSLMMGPKKVVVKNAMFLTGQKMKKDEHDMDILQKYINSPNEDTDLIFVVPYEKLDQRKKIVKSLKEKAIIIEAAVLKSIEARKWIKEESKNLNIELSSEAIEHLYMMVGSNLQMLSSELQKIALYVGEKRKVDTEVIHLLVKKILEQNVFIIIEKIEKKLYAEAHSFYKELIIQKVETIAIAAMISKQFSRMLEVKAHLHNGAEQKQLASLLGVQPYAAKVIASQARGFHETTIQQILHRMSQMDYEFKKTGADKQLLFEMFLVDLKNL
jgi:DNA polymerase-3 subunit delta